MILKPQNKVKYQECKVQGQAAAEGEQVKIHKLRSLNLPGVFLHF